MQALRRILGMRWYDKVSNTVVNERTKLPDLPSLIADRRHSLFGHIGHKRISDKCTKAINASITNTENNLISDGRIGNFYKYVNNGSSGIAPLKSTDGQLLYNKLDKSALLNNYFSNVFTKDNGFIDKDRLPKKDRCLNVSCFYHAWPGFETNQMA